MSSTIGRIGTISLSPLTTVNGVRLASSSKAATFVGKLSLNSSSESGTQSRRMSITVSPLNTMTQSQGSALALIVSKRHFHSHTSLFDVMQRFNDSIAHFDFQKPTLPRYFMPMDKEERLERLQLVNDLRFFGKIAQEVKRLTKREGYSAVFSELFDQLHHFKVDASDLTVTSEKLKFIRNKYEDHLIDPIAQLNEENFQSIIALLDPAIPQQLAWKQSLKKARQLSPKMWNEKVFRQGFDLGNLKKTHAEMILMLECTALFRQNQTFDDIKTTLLVKRFYNFLEEHPLFKDQAQSIAQKLATGCQADGQLSLPQFEKLLGDLLPDTMCAQRKKDLLGDLNAKVNDVDQQMGLLDILLKKDDKWFAAAASKNESQIQFCKYLMRDMEKTIYETKAFLDACPSKDKLTQEQADKMQELMAPCPAYHQALSKAFNEMAVDYWSHKNAAVQKVIGEVSKSSQLGVEMDAKNWKDTVVAPSKTFFTEVKKDLEGKALSANTFAMQREFLPNLLKAKKMLEKNPPKNNPIHSFFRHFFS